MALTSLERDRLYDEVVAVIAFGDADLTQRSAFRATIEDNGLIACDANWDEISSGGVSATQGTPWGTDEMIYEITVRFLVKGEFVSDVDTTQLVPLSAIKVYPYVEGEPDPRPGTSWL